MNMNQTPVYPCNRGNKYGLNRGYHHFQATEYGVVCTYCGERGPEQEVKVTYSNRTDPECEICGGHHSQTPFERHPWYYQQVKRED